MSRPKPSVDELRRLFTYDPETGILAPASGYIYCRHREDGYRSWKIDDSYLYEHWIAWAIMTGEYPAETVDHKDLNGLNNRWENLRLASQAQQQANRRKFKNNKSGFRGVYADGKSWAAQIRFDKKTRHLGSFATPEEAAKAVQAAREARWGEYASAA